MTGLEPWLLDTQLLLWWAVDPQRLPAGFAESLQNPDQPVMFSVVSLWEVAIKASLGRPDFQVNALALRQGLRANGFSELPITAEQVIAAQVLPWIHRDPFDRLLVAVSQTEGVPLITADASLSRYGPGMRCVA
jgi:PIN domain nuclease of toxin-antitoxin system